MVVVVVVEVVVCLCVCVRARAQENLFNQTAIKVANICCKMDDMAVSKAQRVCLDQ